MQIFSINFRVIKINVNIRKFINKKRKLQFKLYPILLYVYEFKKKKFKYLFTDNNISRKYQVKSSLFCSLFKMNHYQ